MFTGLPTSASFSVGLASILALGFVLGMRHATDADHVVAISTIVSRERRVSRAALIGLMWGAGHTLTIVAVGVGIIVFALVIPPRLGLSMEFSVGVMLVLLGGLNLWERNLERRIPPRADSEDLATDVDTTDVLPGGSTHGHIVQAAEYTLNRVDSRFGRNRFFQWVRPLIVGLVHGLAGSAAVALLVLATVHNPVWALAYLLVFGFGTIGGMMLITIAMASVLRYAGSRSEWINRRLSIATGFISMAFGLFIVYQMGYVHGLFSAHPSWTAQ